MESKRRKIKMEKYQEYFNTYCVEDKDVVVTISKVAEQALKLKFNMDFEGDDNTCPLVAVMFAKIYESFMSDICDMKSKFDTYELNIANRLAIGFKTTTDEDDEKMGNFMVYITPLMTTFNETKSQPSTSTAVELSTQWVTENIIEQPEMNRKLAINAVNKLKDIDIVIANSVLIHPIFIVVYEAIVNTLKKRRAENDEFEYEINFMSCFYIGARESDEGDDIIYIRPNIEAKLAFKDDEKASSKYE
jgi:hypothetical protein